ncbi:hypothetical protein IX296_001381 [Bacteroides pyogenes]|nr:hypothetical protein [Bacteroides pyogenes]MBR8725195.1 hypothetical protein [Bacteroides pyogenes]MBR8738616.1 hypothetical protein [Bacteroides pyogenes]MBR8754358.1 hypothetical protein [Bacteroides pyogenes]MBR8795783.1 hypothetical protein [Bacteroides pyogenes]
MEDNINEHSIESRIELRSEKIRKAIGPIPKGLVYGGYAVIILIFIILLLCVIFIPYPYGNGETILRHFL